MEMAVEMPADMSLDRFWSRRFTHHEETTCDTLLDIEHFPPAQVEDDEILTKGSRPSSPTFCIPCSRKVQVEDVTGEKCACEEVKDTELDAAILGDLPCRYTIPRPESHEMAAVGVYIDTRILPGFKYKIRPIMQNGKKKYLFGGVARQIESIGRGYSRRVTLTPTQNNLNSNPDIFWTDSSEHGYAFEIQVIAPGDKFTLHDANHIPVGSLEISSNQGPQVECGQTVYDGKVEKSVRFKALCKVEWFHEENNNILVPLSGVAVCQAAVGGKSGCSILRVAVSSLGHHRGFTLVPGVSPLRSVHLSGASVNDVPTQYTISGLESHQLPVIGTYVDQRIVPGFYYSVQTCGNIRRPLFKGNALRLDAIGRGYAKRLTFASDSLNHPENHLWSDSHADGIALSHAAVRPSMSFAIKAGSVTVGHAVVFRADTGPQVELSQTLEPTKDGVAIVKRIQVDAKCEVTLDMGAKEKIIPHVMRMSGIAVLSKTPKQREAEIIRIEDIGLDSHLNVLFSHLWPELVFYPIKN